jgi:hypothetical protein
MEFTYSKFTVGELAGTLNDTVCLFASQMFNEGIISKEQCENMTENYLVVVREKGWWGKFLDKIQGIEDNNLSIHIVKIVGTGA